MFTDDEKLMFKLGFESFIKEAVGMMQYAGSNAMPFPNDYWKSLKSGSGNLTYRADDEIGKYKVRQTYRATSYGGRDLNVDVRIVSVDRVRISDVPPVHACRIARDYPGAKEADKIKFEVLPRGKQRS